KSRVARDYRIILVIHKQVPGSERAKDRQIIAVLDAVVSTQIYVDDIVACWKISGITCKEYTAGRLARRITEKVKFWTLSILSTRSLLEWNNQIAQPRLAARHSHARDRNFRFDADDFDDAQLLNVNAKFAFVRPAAANRTAWPDNRIEIADLGSFVGSAIQDQ